MFQATRDDAIDKSLLVLFFKKELLAFLAFQRLRL